ncbi:hypothetical protein [Sulfurimonas sp.]|jgi:uncharacterized protein YcfL|nr:hypothetical protein [Sulfurimonas sp.]MDY0123524.1 hypothetical protein [Sulfurimonas sp.]
MRFLFLASITLLIFWGCSSKEINEGVENITSDITNAFEGAKDKSGD